MANITPHKDERDYATDRFREWMFNPDIFVKEVVFANAPKGDGPSQQQIEGLQAVGKIAFAMVKAHNIRQKRYIFGKELSEEELLNSRKKGLAIRSGHGCGKDAFLCWVYLWLLVCFHTERCRGQVTAVNQTQLRTILWTEFRYWIKYSAENQPDGISILSDMLVVESDKIFHKDFKGISFVQAKTANVKSMDESEQGEALAGAHGPFMILAADEASGLPRGVFKPVEGAMTQMMNFAILIGNPTRYTGYFRDCFYEDRKRWLCLHWNAEDSSLVKPEILEEDLKQYGRDSNWYRIRRLGEFPLAEPDALIPLDWIEAAVNRDITPDITEPVILGCDIARYGNSKSVICPLQGFKVSPMSTRSKSDTVETAGWINEHMDDLRAAVACVDVIGIGAGVVDNLKHNRRRVIGVDVSRVALNPKFINRRAELYWKLRMLFEENRISIPDDNELQGELSGIKFAYNLKNKLLIESKEDRRKRGLKSPDKAEALMLALAANAGAYVRAPLDVFDNGMDGKEKYNSQDGWMGA